MRSGNARAARRRGGSVLLLLALALLVAGCGAEDAGNGGDAGEDSGGGRPGPGIELTVTYWPEGRDGEAREAVLICEPDGGTHPSAEKACLVLRGNPDALEPLGPGTMCTQIYGGPEEAEVTGVVDGEQVQAAFSRQNGCEIDRWDRLVTVLQPQAP